jgi:hypothetical protein
LAAASIALAAPMPEGGYAGTAQATYEAPRPPDVADAAQGLYSTPQGLAADGLRLQAIAHAYQDSQAATVTPSSSPTAQGLRADGMRYQAIAQAYTDASGSSDATSSTAT